MPLAAVWFCSCCCLCGRQLVWHTLNNAAGQKERGRQLARERGAGTHSHTHTYTRQTYTQVIRCLAVLPATLSIGRLPEAQLDFSASQWLSGVSAVWLTDPTPLTHTHRHPHTPTYTQEHLYRVLLVANARLLTALLAAWGHLAHRVQSSRCCCWTDRCVASVGNWRRISLAAP